MNRIYLAMVAVMFIGSLGAQTRSNTKSKISNTKKQTVRKAPVQTNSEPANIRDRINQRLKDSAASGSGATSTLTTVINGISVTTGATTATSSSNANGTSNSSTVQLSSTNGNSVSAGNSATTTGGNSVTNMGSPVQGRPIPGTIPVTPSNPANVPGKPTTQEQTKFSSTDINRTQMNAINGNQVASSAQNPDNTTKNVSGNMGESQWGTNQVGENQWTPPNNIVTGFTRDFPSIRGATWTRDNTMNTFSARFKTGDLWTSTTYNSGGYQMETRTELPLLATLPESLISFKKRQSALVDFNRITRLERPGKETLYEVRLTTGRVAYLNNKGEEVPLQ